VEKARRWIKCIRICLCNSRQKVISLHSTRFCGQHAIRTRASRHVARTWHGLPQHSNLHAQQNCAPGNVLTAQTLQVRLLSSPWSLTTKNPSALQAFDMMYTAGCLPDQSQTPTVRRCGSCSNPSDLYFFQLPMGISLPNNTTPSCSSCTKS